MGKLVKAKKSNFENFSFIFTKSLNSPSTQREEKEENTTNKTGPIRVGKKKHQTEINLARKGKIQSKGKDGNLSPLSIREDEALVL